MVYIHSLEVFECLADLCQSVLLRVGEIHLNLSSVFLIYFSSKSRKFRILCELCFLSLIVGFSREDMRRLG